MAHNNDRYVGQRFRHLLVLSIRQVRYGSKNRTTYKALCACDCGTKKEVFVNALFQGKTGSCGCDKSRYEKTSGSRNYLFKGVGEIRAAFWNGYKEGARVRQLPFELTMDYAWQLYEAQGRRCALSGVTLQFGPIGLPKGSRNRKSRTTASLDRIDNSKGYVEGNVQWVHKQVNVMRNTLPVSEFVAWCAQIAAHSQKPSMKSDQV